MAPPPLEIETVLVPVDASDEAIRATEYALAIAATYDATVHAMYVLGEELSRGVTTGVVSPTEIADESHAVSDTIDDLAATAGVTVTHSTAYGFSPLRKLVHPGSVILDCADQINADFLVIPRESGRGSSADVLEKAAEYVLLYASQPVLSV